MSIFNGIQKTSAEQRYEKILMQAPSLKQGEENRCKVAYESLWGTDAVWDATYSSRWHNLTGG